MKKVLVFVSGLLLLMIFSSNIIEAETQTGRSPKFDKTRCANGGWSWTVKEDKDKDGFYDWITIRKCDGSIVEEPLEQGIESDLGDVGVHTTDWTPNFTSSECTSGYSWLVEEEEDATGAILAEVEADCSGNITITTTALPPAINSVNDLNDGTFKIYPNPAENSINIDLNADLNIVGEIRIVNEMGRTVKEVTLNSDQNNLNIDVSNLNNGIYFIRINMNSETIIKKIQVVK